MSNLFTAVSVEQQEIVAGGAATVPSVPFAFQTTFYDLKAREVTSGISSGQLGTTIVNNVRTLDILTGGAAALYGF